MPLIHEASFPSPLPGLFNLPLFRKPERGVHSTSCLTQKWKCISYTAVDGADGKERPPAAPPLAPHSFLSS